VEFADNFSAQSAYDLCVMEVGGGNGMGQLMG
jgi:hypothetical protein